MDDASRRDGTKPIGPHKRASEISETPICRNVSHRISWVRWALSDKTSLADLALFSSFVGQIISLLHKI
jgi:hypothetical protein